MLSQFDAEVREIRGRFIAKAAAQQVRLQAIEALLEGSPSSEVLDELHHISRWLSGSAPTFGFNPVGVAADSLESAIISQRSSGTVDSAALTAFCNRLLNAMQESFQQADPAGGTSSDNG